MSTRTTTIRTRRLTKAAPHPQDCSVLSHEKENVNMNGSSGKARAAKRGAKTYCLCKKADDGSPMIHCSTCKDWYHFRCVDLSERDAEEIQSYVCPACHEKTGARIIKEWEGPDTTQAARSEDTQASSSAAKDKETKVIVTPKEDEPQSDAESDGTEDYDPEADKAPKRRTRRPTYHSDGDSDSGESHRATSPKRIRRTAAGTTEKEPARKPSMPSMENNPAKRKKSTSSQPAPPPAKRPRSESTTGEDAARKYCLTKLQELFRQIFTRYPFLAQHTEDETAPEPALQPDKKSEELTPEEKEQLEGKANLFGVDLENCMYELYSEPDKSGKQMVGGKYKERFRMLTFNLSKADRVVLHMRIASSHITPKELSTMSSTDLASESEKQSIKKLEEEALAHSILKKSIVPRAKITHKGLQDIEDVTGAGRREVEREREEEEEERIERERLARLRVQAQRSQSMGSVPPESPVVGQAPTHAWGAPPPVPAHATPQAGEPASPSSSLRPPAHPLFVPSASDFAGGPVENELNLADLINIDEESTGEIAMSHSGILPNPFAELPPVVPEAKPEAAPQPQSARSPTTPSTAPGIGISPFAAKGSQPDTPSRSSFDLNALWTPTATDQPPQLPPTGSQPQAEPSSSRPVGQQNESDLLGGQADDQDFDMFLNHHEPDPPEEEKAPEPVEPTPEEKRATFDTQTPVWNGIVSMPLDSTIPQEVAVVARQLGGRSLGSDSSLWQTLFPSKELRIDGRVPVEKSAQYLTQVRLNPSKELIAAAFSPAPGADTAGFHALKSHLLSKGRHGLIFPWGHNPKSSAPGRELYVVPLLSTDPIPEYMELLDQLQLPTERIADYLVGVWVLTKGKLSPPPQPAPVHVSTPQPSVTPPSLPNTDFSHLQHANVLPQGPQLTQSQVPLQAQLTAGGSMSPLSASLSNSTPDFSSLTPEQITLMLQTLSRTSSQSPPTSMPIPGLSSSQQPIALPTAAAQAWNSQVPGPYPPPPAYPQVQQPPPYPGNGSPTSQRPPGAYGNDRFNDQRPYQNHPNNGFEYRGRGGRGRGAGDRGRGRDQGWQKAGFGSRGRGGAPPTGPRNRGGGGGGWGGEQQRWG
ncbi:transcription factor [Ganoderma sinense ZZ0214-1]|uniref:Transcription factor BYE1 n=1 Tax=Ganoderma sinense ZZ0214-1 TaxID=1077348 RepID=A0A2G8RUE3_9APHY|nr:transcription factor [Ganoderma sinense ZZ0214-1]